MTWIVDAHCHLSDKDYESRREEILDRLPQNGVLAIINPASDEESSREGVYLARRNKRVFACMGTHPLEANSYSASAEYVYRTLAMDPRLVAMGEMGLDYHYNLATPDRQKEVFIRQLRLAQELDLPVVIHCREAAGDLIPILLREGRGLRILLHSFNEPLDCWEALAPLDPYISIGGMVTFKNAPNPKRLAEAVPLDRLLIETDGPYLAPVPKRGRLNMPWYSWYSLAAVAQIRQMDLETLSQQVLDNTARFYGLKEAFARLKVEEEGEGLDLSAPYPFAEENYVFPSV